MNDITLPLAKHATYATQNHVSLHYPVPVQTLPTKGRLFHINLKDDERQTLAARYDLCAVHHFNADIKLLPWKGSGVRVTGRLSVVFVQNCVISLEEIESQLDELFEALYVPADSKLANTPAPDAKGVLLFEAHGPEIPEIFHGSTINLGSIIEEFFSLNINPYPRKESAFLSPICPLGKEEKDSAIYKTPAGDDISPFAILKKHNE
ncbi:YceD family protein [Bartonella sp. DGB2]|uniref:YceD family protein n=1 Tax=Bartonella sp. DGB2 TaxID=3388426 RepID=UPI0039900BD1